MNDPIVNERRAQTEADSILHMEDVIRNGVTVISKLKQELKDQREMYNDSFTNNTTFRENEALVKQATLVRNKTALEIAKQPSVILNADKIKELAQDIKERKESLSATLVAYKEKTQATQLELFEGQTMEIVQSAKLRRISKR